MIDKDLALLVEELKKDGVDKGQQEADDIIAEAKKEADGIIARAKQEAREEVNRAKEEADSISRMTASGAKQAGVSLISSLKQSVDKLLQQSFGTIVRQGMEDQEVVAKMLVTFADNLKPGTNATVTVSDAVDLETLEKAVMAAASQEVAKGVELRSAPNFPGISVQLKGESVKYELTEKLLKEMIGPFLSERARRLLFP